MLIRSPLGHAELNKPTVVTLGNFDGIHIGHQALARRLIQVGAEKDLVPTVITFEPTPKEFFLGVHAPARLSTLREKYQLLSAIGVSQVLCIRFNRQFANIHAEQFIQNCLVDMLGIKHILVGSDFRFGKSRTGDYELLSEMSAVHNYVVEKSTTIFHGPVRASSSLVRRVLREGDFKHAESILGRPFSISGKVFYGDRRGRQLGFPTANIVLRRKVSPVQGVFAVRACDENGECWQGVANVGHRPTVNGNRCQLEAHLFECDRNLYGKRLCVTFISKIRDEKKFASLEQLQQQIAIDTEQARELFTL